MQTVIKVAQALIYIKLFQKLFAGFQESSEMSFIIDEIKELGYHQKPFCSSSSTCSETFIIPPRSIIKYKQTIQGQSSRLLIRHLAAGDVTNCNSIISPCISEPNIIIVGSFCTDLEDCASGSLKMTDCSVVKRLEDGRLQLLDVGVESAECKFLQLYAPILVAEDLLVVVNKVSPKDSIKNFASQFGCGSRFTVYGCNSTYYEATNLTPSLLDEPAVDSHLADAPTTPKGAPSVTSNNYFASEISKLASNIFPHLNISTLSKFEEYFDNEEEDCELIWSPTITQDSMPGSVCAMSPFRERRSRPGFLAKGQVILTALPLFKILRAAINCFSAGGELDPAITAEITDAIAKLCTSQRGFQTDASIPLLILDYNSGPTPDVDYFDVIQMISPRNLVTLVLSCLLEQKILIISRRSITLTTMLCELIRACIKPLYWAYLYEPALPSTMLSTLTQCPLPFIIGCTTRPKSLATQGLIVYDLDRDSCKVPKSLVELIKSPGKHLLRQIDGILKPECSYYDSPSYLNESTDKQVSKQQIVENIFDIFRQHIVYWVGIITQGSLKISSPQDIVYLLDNSKILELLSLESKADLDKFFEAFTQTQNVANLFA